MENRDAAMLFGIPEAEGNYWGEIVRLAVTNFGDPEESTFLKFFRHQQ